MGNIGQPLPFSKHTSLPWYYRLYFFGLHGFFDEIVFTSLHDFIFEDRDIRLRGHSSLYSFLIYGLGSLQCEYIYFRYLKNRVGLLGRSFFYVFFGFSWEFFTGLLLSSISACPWDYSHKPYNVMGLITLDYAPLWIMAGWMQEAISDFLSKVRICNDDTKEKEDS